MTQPIDEDIGEAVPEIRKGALRRGFALLRHILPYVKPFWPLAVGVVIMTVLLAAAMLAQPWPIAFVVDGVVGSDQVPGLVTTFVGTETGQLILFGAVAMLIVTAAVGGFTVISEYLAVKLEQRVVLNFRSDLFRHAHRLSLSYHDEARTGMLMYRINNQAKAVGSVIIGLPQLAQSALTVVGMAFITYRIDPQLALLAVSVVPFIYYSVNYYADRIDPELRRVRGLEGTNLSIVHEAMAMMRVVVAFGGERHEYRRFRKQGERTVEARIRLTIKQTLFRLCVNMITAAGTAAVLFVGAHRVINGNISTGELLIVIAYIAAVYEPLEQLAKILTTFQQHFIAVDHSLTLLSEPPAVAERSDARSIGRSAGRLELRDVSFDYPTRPEVLRDISLVLEPGETLAIVGPTGAGKSTLINLLPRFYDPSRGEVLLDGIDVRDLTVESVREQFSIVLQEPLLFSESITNNILYGRPDATPEDVHAAARAANAHDFIRELPAKYGTKLGERGATLSGGERQRISLARAFLRDAPILILDEPTSAIDSQTEQTILDAIDRLMEGRTTIIIAHRLATVRKADKVIVMDEGRIVQAGTFDELRRQDGLFNLLWDAQTGSLLAMSGEPPEAAGALPAAADGDRAAVRVDGPEAATGIEAPAEIVDGAPAQRTRPKLVLLGMLTKMPVPGPAWLVGQYATGFERLGFEVYYVEDHGRAPTEFMTHRHDGTAAAADYLATTLAELGLLDRWAYRPSRDGDRIFGLGKDALERLYGEATLIINMHGGTDPSDEQATTGRLVYLGTDPADIELRLADGNVSAHELMSKHSWWFTWALNADHPDCRLPRSDEFPLIPTRPPVIPGNWMHRLDAVRGFSTIGNWQQDERVIVYQGETYEWSKHHEFQRVIELPSAAHPASFELALANLDRAARARLEAARWQVRGADQVAGDLASYQRYIQQSQGEFSVAKDQNIRFRTGWFGERSAFYLMSGRPVIVQDTGIGGALPVGEGLLTFDDLDTAAAAIDQVLADPDGQRVAAFTLGLEHFRSDVVLTRMLDAIGVELPADPTRGTSLPEPHIPAQLDLVPVSRRPLQFSDVTHQWVSSRGAPAVTWARRPDPAVSIVVIVWNALDCTKLCLESVLANTKPGSGYELVIVDNGSDHPTREYLAAVAARNAHVRLLRLDHNEGFAGGVNRGIEVSGGRRIVLLNSDTVVSPGWLHPLIAALSDDEIGLIGPRTNRCGNDAELPTGYRTYGELLDYVAEHHTGRAGALIDVDVAVMFCVAFRRDLYDEIGGLDERFGMGMFEDDDYSRRVRATGRRVVYTTDSFVHHMGEASLGELAPSGELGQLFERNRALFEEKWGVEWTTHTKSSTPAYEQLRDQVRVAIADHVPFGATVLIVSRGDDVLIELAGNVGWHFPRTEAGGWSGEYPPDSSDAIARLADGRQAGARYFVLPEPARWWFDRYEAFAEHLDREHTLVVDVAGVAAIYELAPIEHDAAVGPPDARGRAELGGTGR